MPPDSYQISLNIIEAIKQHPVLYCTEVKGLPVKLQEFKQKVWKRIADELGLDRKSLCCFPDKAQNHIIRCLRVY